MKSATAHAELPPQSAIQRPFTRFVAFAATEGVMLMLCTVIALLWANSPWAESYDRIFGTRVTVGVGAFALSKPLILWINDGLMAIFFFVVGLEIKREALVGELASPRKAALPIVAAVGGMVVPAGLYAIFNHGGPGASGWGIPMATDIAFALGVMTLMGKAVPLSLKVFLTALAIVDDIGAVLVIAIFYTSELHWGSLAMAGAFLAALIAFSRLGGRHSLVYLILGIGLWVGFLKSGVHATLAGVVLAMTIPARSRLVPDQFLKEGRRLLDEFDRADEHGNTLLSNERQQSAVHAMEAACERVQTPMSRMESALHPWVSFAIMPVFALANAGVPLSADLLRDLAHPVALGVTAGLVLGKPLGVVVLAALAIRLGWAERPRHANWRQIWGVGCLAGIGFTMSLFIAHLAVHESLLQLAKVAILGASIVSGVLGWLLLRGARTR